MSLFWTILGLGVLFVAMTWWAIFHIASRDFGSFEKKAAWGAVAMVPFLGVLVYIVWGRKHGKRPQPGENTEDESQGEKMI